MMFSNVGDSVVEVVGIIYGGKETKVLVIGSIEIAIGVPFGACVDSLDRSPSPMVTFTSVLDMFVVMSEVCTSS